MYLICSLRKSQSPRSKVELKGCPGSMCKAAINVSNPSWETIYRANSSCAFTPSPGEGHVQRSAQLRAAASARFCGALLSNSAVLFPTTAPSGPSAGLSMPGLGARHRREDRRPLPGWKIRSESVSSRAMLVWAAQANAVGNPNQGRRSP